MSHFSCQRRQSSYAPLLIQNSARDVKYDLRILADRIEFCWIHLRGVGALENSLWGYDGDALRIWLDALTISSHKEPSPTSSVVENVRLPLEFYPLCRSESYPLEFPFSRIFSGFDG
jgi:RIC1